jgi:hypothetical protein
MDVPTGCGALSEGCTDEMRTVACAGAHSAASKLMRYQTLVFVAFMKVPADQFAATVTVSATVAID